MKDLLGNDIKVGDKVAFLPRKENHSGFQYNMQYGTVTKMTLDKSAAYCKSISLVTLKLNLSPLTMPIFLLCER